MLEQEELILDLIALAHLGELLLKLHAVLVRDEMQLVKIATAHGSRYSARHEPRIPFNFGQAGSERLQILDQRTLLLISQPQLLEGIVMIHDIAQRGETAIVIEA